MNKTIYNILKLTKKNYGDITSLNQTKYNELLEYLDQTINIFYPELKDKYKTIIDSLYKPTLIYELDEKKMNLLNIDNIDNNNINKMEELLFGWLKYKKVEDRDEHYDNMRFNINTNLIELNNQYEKLINLPQPVQKSKEWFDLRNNMITASSCAAAIGEEKYKTIKNIIEEKIGLGKGFLENKFVYHGKKYEKIAILIYEQIYNSKVGEFGLIPHPTHTFLGASPDGINII